MSTLRNFVFTINNYNDDSLNDLKDHHKLRYLIAGREVGASGTPHLQGYAELTCSVRFNTLKKLLPTAHIEKRRGSAEDASNYCKKDGDIFVEIGKISHQGKTAALVEACEMIQYGEKNREVALTHPITYVKFHKGLNAFRSAITPPRDTEPEVIIIYGPTGVGKSRLARHLTEDPYVWAPQQERWFCGYQSEDHTIFEEFRGQFPFGMVLSLTDRYSCRVQTKGAMIEFVSTKIIFTSPRHPRDWYELLDKDDHWNQFERRITKVIHLTSQDDIQKYFLSI